MRSPSLERIYAQLNRHILLAQSYTEISELMFIIKSCRLKPYSFVFDKRDTKLVLHRWWIDEFGNSFKIVKNKRIKIIHNDLSLNRDNIVSTDLYYGLSLDKIARISKIVFLCAGKDEDYQPCFFVSFLGIDNYLRTYTQTDGKWTQVSPLCLGLKNLKTLARNTDIKHFREIAIKENFPIPCVAARGWISFMPPNREFVHLLRREYDDTLSFIDVNTKEQK